MLLEVFYTRAMLSQIDKIEKKEQVLFNIRAILGIFLLFTFPLSSCDKCMSQCLKKFQGMAVDYCYLKDTPLMAIKADVMSKIPNQCHLGKDNIKEFLEAITIPLFQELHALAKNNTVVMYFQKNNSQLQQLALICDLYYSPYCCQ